MMPKQPKQQKPWEPPSGSKVVQLWGEMQDDLLEQRRSYWLNTSFCGGQQWVGWEDASSSVTTLGWSSDDEVKTRATVNKIRPRVDNMLGRMLRVPLAFEVRPDGVDATYLHSAQISGSVLEAKSHRRNWSKIRHENVQNMLFGGVSAIAAVPDWEFEDEAVADGYGDFVQMPSRPATKLQALSCAEFGIEVGTRDLADARHWISATCASPAQVQERYELDEAPAADADVVNSAMQRSLLSARKSQSSSKQTQVLVYYERPGRNSEGCELHVVGGKVVEQSGWPFPFKDRLNLYTFVQTSLPGTWKGDTFLNDTRAIQKSINRAYSTFNEHALRVSGAKMAVGYGTQMPGDDEMSSEVGEYVYYEPSAGPAPQWMQPPQIPRWLREHVDNQVNDLDDLFHAHAVTQGVAPGSRNSGSALAILAEKDDTPLGLMGADQQQGWQALAEMCLATDRHLMVQVDEAQEQEAQQQAQMNPMQAGPPPQPMQVTDVIHTPGVEQPEEVRWSAKDLPERPTVYVPRDNVMPKSKAAEQDQMIHFQQSFPQLFANFSAPQLAKMLQLSDASMFDEVSDKQVAEAQWENRRFKAGADDSEVIVQDWQNHDIHYQVHNEFRASSAYRNAGPEVQGFVDDHIMAHIVLVQEQMKAKAKAEAEATPPPAPEPAKPAAKAAA